MYARSSALPRVAFTPDFHVKAFLSLPLGQHPKEVGNSIPKEIGNSNLKEVCNNNPKEIGNNCSKDVGKSTLPASILIPHLQNLVQQASFQQELITTLLNSLQQNDIADEFQAAVSFQVRNPKNEKLLDTAKSESERVLLSKISELQARIIALTEELTGAKMKHIQLQQELNALYCGEEEERRTEVIEER